MERIGTRNHRKFKPEHYISVILKKYDTGEKVPCMFTEVELSDMEKITAKWLRLKNNILYATTIGRKPVYLWYSRKLGHIFRISPYQLDRGIERAECNPNDFPEKHSGRN